MKKMTIEEKAQAYDEALKRAKILYNDKNEIGYANAESVLEEVFPLLKESDDERIRKALIEYFGEQCDMSDWNGVYGYQVVAWLEKQGEQKSIWHNEDEEPQRDSLILLVMQNGTPIVAKIIEPNHTFNHGERWAYIDDLLEKQNEQKPTIEMKSAEESLGIDSDIYNEIVDECIYGEQKPTWSEEDKDFMYDTLSNLTELKDRYGEGYGNVGKCIDWLKFLKDRYTWKPSDEQMKALHDLNLTGNISYVGQGQVLIGLYNDLKKLKGE